MLDWKGKLSIHCGMEGFLTTSFGLLFESIIPMLSPHHTSLLIGKGNLDTLDQGAS